MNPNYCGRVINKYGQYDNMFPSIVSTNMNEQAQALRSQNKSNEHLQTINSNKNQMPLLRVNPHYQYDNSKRTMHYVTMSVLRNMNASHFVCEFKGINAPKLETQVLTTCQDFFQNQQLYLKINDVIQKQIKTKGPRN